MRLLVVTGLRREARILSGPGIETVAGGGDAARLEAVLGDAVRIARGVISLGIAGALAPGLAPGDWVVAEAVLDGAEAIPADAAWRDRLAAALPGARTGLLLGSDTMVADAAAKAARHAATGAIAVDMESHVAARVARRHGVPFAAARVVSDAADRDLPPAARVGMRPDGGMDLPAVLRALAARPGQLPALLRTGWEAERAFCALLRGRKALGPGLAAA
ncbi:hopanoid-associated phosphorylase [Roseomonas sp. OT10]|uniref:phosphorylase family protein n=1 Tax=Roseomonas cutis TaxID=2897332 RepID=UPI001E50BDCB|nr:hopanoid-associated phosphorylase [Roseomonas sp. OT10]UFN48017.1 hopanoid-associated phosphorylase [Roseomonas sp. OT10]